MGNEIKNGHKPGSGGARKGAGRKPRSAQTTVALLDSGEKAVYVKADRAIGVREEFERLLTQSGATNQKLSMRIAEGLDAQETVFAKFEGKITDSRDVIAWGERRAYAEMICKIKRVITPENELPRELPAIQVNIVHIGASPEPPQLAVNITHVDKER